MTGFSLPSGLWLGRVWRAGIGPSLVTLRAGHVVDITSTAAPTMRDLLELPDIAGFVASQPGEDLGLLETLFPGSVEAAGDTFRLLAPCDLHAIKACGVTFARSMVERVIEERAAGNPALAAEIRARVAGVIGDRLRDVEGRSALLLGKAKDNNAAASVGPFIRLFDADFTLDSVRGLELTLTVTGKDGFGLQGASSMRQISRDPADLVTQTRGRHHQYPDGFVLYCGTMFSPVQDRDGPGQGFTHHLGDVVTISAPELGSLTNIVRLATEAPEWRFGTGALMRNLAARQLL